MPRRRITWSPRWSRSCASPRKQRDHSWRSSRRTCTHPTPWFEKRKRNGEPARFRKYYYCKLNRCKLKILVHALREGKSRIVFLRIFQMSWHIHVHWISRFRGEYLHRNLGLGGLVVSAEISHFHLWFGSSRLLFGRRIASIAVGRRLGFIMFHWISVPLHIYSKFRTKMIPESPGSALGPF